MHIRHATFDDLPTLMGVFAYARDFMARKGNAHQWGHNHWPPEELIKEDIARGKSYVIEEEGHIYGTFYLDYGSCPEPCYLKVYEGEWKEAGAYAVIHRIASSGEKKGILLAAVNHAFNYAPIVRIDTHESNVVMDGALRKLGFKAIGYIYVPQDTERRRAYELRREHG